MCVSAIGQCGRPMRYAAGTGGDQAPGKGMPEVGGVDGPKQAPADRGKDHAPEDKPGERVKGKQGGKAEDSDRPDKGDKSEKGDRGGKSRKGGKGGKCGGKGKGRGKGNPGMGKGPGNDASKGASELPGGKGEAPGQAVAEAVKGALGDMAPGKPGGEEAPSEKAGGPGNILAGGPTVSDAMDFTGILGMLAQMQEAISALVRTIGERRGPVDDAEDAAPEDDNDDGVEEPGAAEGSGAPEAAPPAEAFAG